MAVTYQSYEWMNTKRTVNAQPEAMDSNINYDIFTGTTGNSISTANLVRSTQFVVLEEVGLTPFRGANLQLVINTTSYFENPDKTVSQGIPGLASPYPVGSASGNIAGLTDSILPFGVMKNLPIYILPGQHWSFQFNVKTSIVAGAESAASVGCSIVYTLYDGPDAMIANKLLEKGFPVTEDTVNTYKVNLLAQQELMEGYL